MNTAIAFVLAAAIGVASSALYYVLKIPMYIFSLPLRFLNVIIKRKNVSTSRVRSKNSIKKLCASIYDALFILICSLLYSLYCYVALDGILRVLPLALGCVSYFAARRFVFSRLFSFLYSSNPLERSTVAYDLDK